jgi:DNA-binding IclR family transcriptional regulator
VAIAVWGTHGPTIVRTHEAPLPVHVAMRHGAVMSLRGTASGRLFAAHLPAAWCARQWRAVRDKPFDKAFEQELAAIRSAGLSHAVDAAVPGVSGLAAPVFDGSGALVLSLTAMRCHAKPASTQRHKAKRRSFDRRPLCAYSYCFPEKTGCGGKI